MVVLRIFYQPILLFFIISLLIVERTLAQPHVNVDTHTGTGSISIPLYSLQEGEIEVPVSLSYNASGVKVTDVSGMTGMGWYLNAGGGISRELRGLPDDKSTHGWLHNGMGSVIESFSTSASESVLFQSLEALDPADDTDPDIFHINTPFISGQFFFDNNGSIRLETHQDLKISYELQSDQISSFEITDAKGIKYLFAVSDIISESVEFDTPEVFFKRIQEQFGTTVTYNSNWHLTSILLPNGSTIRFNYSKLPTNNHDIKKSWATGVERPYKFEGSATGSFGKKYKLSASYILNEIKTSSGDRAEFEIVSRYDEIADHKLTGLRFYKRNTGLIKELDLFYKKVLPVDTEVEPLSPLDIIFQKRTFLSAIHQRSNDQILPGYTFDYYGVDQYLTYLPEYSSTARDFWGYYNGHEASGTESMVLYIYPGLDNDNRYRAEPLPNGHSAKNTEIVIGGKNGIVNPEKVFLGSLSKVSYPGGGNTRLYYEPNEYFDEVAQSTYLGCGIRVKKTVTHDGVSNKNNITTHYKYNQVSSNVTSGLLIERPKYAFATPYKHDVFDNGTVSSSISSYADIIAGNDPYAHLTIRTNFDLNGGSGSQVRYSHVEVRQEGKGGVSYDYVIPAAMDASSANGEWSPTSIQIARGTISGGYEAGHTQIGTNVFPLSYNTNYDFERGLLNKTEARDEQGNLVSSTWYEYDRIYTGSAVSYVYGLDYDKLPTYESGTTPPTTEDPTYFYVFGKYKIFTGLNNVLSKKTDKIFDPNDETKVLTTITDFTYSTSHKKLSQISTTDSEATINRQYLIYPEDYPITKPAGDDQVKALDSMISKNILAHPVEQYSTAQPLGESEKVVAGSLTLYKLLHGKGILPHEQYELKVPQTSLNVSSIDNSGGSSVFEYDSNYEWISTVESYDSKGNPETVIGRSEIYSGVHRGYDKTFPHVNISNAPAEAVSYSGFETETGYECTFDENEYPTPYTTGRTGLNALSFGVGSNKKLSALIRKGETSIYLLSFWVGNPIAAGTVSATLKNESLTNTYGTKTINFTNDQQWMYYESEIDVGPSPTDFVLELVTDQELVIDDILFYPENASVGYSTLGTKSEMLSTTSPLGVTQFFEYDHLLRNTLIRDDDKNILSVNTYTDRQIEKPINPYFHYKGMNCIGDAVFEYDEPDPAGYNYLWFFGDDPNPVTGIEGSTMTHSYGSDGTFTIKLSASKNGIIADADQTIEINTITKTVGICAAGPKKINACTGAVDEVFEEGCFIETGTSLAPSVFTVGEIGNCHDCIIKPNGYDWEVSLDGGASWSDVGTSTSKSISLFYDATFLVRCKVTTDCTPVEIITSEERQVLIYKSPMSCPNILTAN